MTHGDALTNPPLPPRRDSARARLARVVRSLAFLCGASGVVVLALQALSWFRDGIWPSATFLDLWLAFGHSYSIRSASGTDRWLLQFYTLPAGPTLLVFALIILIAARRLAGTPK